MRNLKLAAVIILYHPTSDYLNTIDNIKQCIDKFYIVDNSENNLILPNLGDSKIEYINNCENLGIAHALNQGAQRAIEDKYQWLLTLDQDSNITSDNVKDLKTFILDNDTSKIGIVSPYHDILTIHEMPSKPQEEKLEVMTSGNIINLELYQKIGGFKDWLFIDGVDIEYGMNLNSHGYKVIQLNDTKMKHFLGNAKIHKIFGKQILCSNHNYIRRYYMVRNNLYIRDMYQNVYPEYCQFLINVQKGQLKRVLFLEKDKIRKLRYMLKGYQDYKKGIKGKIKE